MKTCKRLHQYEPVKHSENGCPFCHNLNNLKWKEKNVNYYKEYYLKNKENHQVRMCNWRKRNKCKQALYSANRKSRELLATPPWLTKTHFAEIEEYFLLAKELAWLSEEPLEVDHIVPLQGKNVCGLHVPWNLQILPESLNRSKRNKHG